MSGKNRAFALAVATAALVGLSAPVASAATSQGSPSGFNNDSVINLSGIQAPVQSCTFAGLTDTVASTPGLTSVMSLLPVLSTGAISPSQSDVCNQNTAETNTTTTNTAPTSAPNTSSTDSDGCMSCSQGSDVSSDPGTSGFNNDSVFNLSGIQMPVQSCTVGPTVSTITDTQALSAIASLFPSLSTGAIAPTQSNTCSQSTAETNSSSVNS
jgi:hypothetical protein